MLLLHKNRSHPKQYSGSRYTKCDHVDARQAVSHGILAQWGHQSPKSTSEKHAQMGKKRLFVIHYSTIFRKNDLFNLKKRCKGIHFIMKIIIFARKKICKNTLTILNRLK